MTRRQPRETGPDTPGTVRVRFTADDESAAGFLVRILRDHPEVELLGEPQRYSGGRIYTRFRLRCACAHQGGCLTCGCTCEPAEPRRCPCCGTTDKPAKENP